MAGIFCIIDHWQTLIGSILGGVFALLTALVVASSAMRSARRTAATLLLVDLLAISRVSEYLDFLAEKEGITEDKYHFWLSERLNWRKPQLSSSYDAYAANLVGVHDALSAHLSLLKMVYLSLDDHLARINADAKSRRINSPLRSLQATEADAKAVVRALGLAGKHAVYAAYFIEQLVLGCTPAFIKRIRMRIFPTSIEKKSQELLRDGGILD